ncbi:hypothetical protein ACE4NI_001661 [Campylobacter jejuni]
MEEEDIKNEYYFLNLKNNIDEFIKDYMSEFFIKLTTKKYSRKIKIRNVEHFRRLKQIEKENFINNMDFYSVALNLLNDLYENLIINDKEFKIFFGKEHKHIRIINEERKGLINIYLSEEKKSRNDAIEIATDGFGSDTYNKKILYYGMNEKDYKLINKTFLKTKLKRLEWII